MKKNVKKFMFPNFIKGQTYFLELFEGDKPYLGLTNFNNHVIEIKKDLDGYDMKKTIYHELLHVYFAECGLRSFADNEILIEFLESIFFEIQQKVEEVFKLSIKEKQKWTN